MADHIFFTFDMGFSHTFLNYILFLTITIITITYKIHLLMNNANCVHIVLCNHKQLY